MSKKQQIVGSMSEWSGMFKDFFRQIGDGSIQKDQFQLFLEHKNPFEFNSNLVREYWQKFYKDNFGIQIDLSKLEIPRPQEDFTWHIVTIKEVTEQMLYNKCKGLFPCGKWTEKDLNDVLKTDRISKGIHIGLFRNRIEADEELKNLSADELEEKGITGITLKQRLTMELDYYLRTGQHLDIQNITLCSSSRYSDDGVPVVYWSYGWMEVNWYDSTICHDCLRSRQQFLS